jgi:hypothetical protein
MPPTSYSTFLEISNIRLALGFMLFNKLGRIFTYSAVFESTLVDFQVFRIAWGFEPQASQTHISVLNC